MGKNRIFSIFILIAVLVCTFVFDIKNFSFKLDVARADANTITFGDKSIFSDAITTNFETAKLTDNKIIATYCANVGGTCYARVGNVAGNSITWGTAAAIPFAINDVSVDALSSDKAVIAYSVDASPYDNGRVAVANISGDTITFGGGYVFSTMAPQYMDIAVIDTDKFVVSYMYYSASGKSQIGTVSGDSISYGAEATFHNLSLDSIETIKLEAGKFAIAFGGYTGGTWGDYAIVGSAPSTTITFGTKSLFNSPTPNNNLDIVALDSSKVLIIYANHSGITGDDPGYAVAATISGDTFSWGTPAQYDSNTYPVGASLVINNSTKATISYCSKNDFKGYSKSVNISGIDVSFGSANEFNGGDMRYVDSVALSSFSFMNTYSDYTNTNKGTARIGSYEIPSENLSDTVTSLTVDAPADHRITLSSPNGSGSASDNLTITFPPEFTTYDYSKFKTNMFASLFLGTAHAAGGLDYTDVDLSHGPTTGYETEETIAEFATDTAWGADFTDNVLTLTHPTNPANGNIQAGDKVIVEIGTIAGGTHQIGNPSVAGQYIVRIEGTFVNNINAALDIKLSDQVQVTGAVDPSISYAISNNSVVFGGITQATVKYATPSGSGSLTPPDNGAFQLTDINTNAANGLSIKAQSNGDGTTNAGFYNSALTELIPASSITSIVAGTDGYALCTKNGTNTVSPTSEFTCESGSQAITRSPQEIANTTAPVANGTVDVDLKAAIDATTPAGSYADTITVIVTGNF